MKLSKNQISAVDASNAEMRLNKAAARVGGSPQAKQLLLGLDYLQSSDLEVKSRGIQILTLVANGYDISAAAANRHLSVCRYRGEGCEVDYTLAYVHNEIYAYLWDMNSEPAEKMINIPDGSKTKIYETMKSNLKYRMNDKELAEGALQFAEWSAQNESEKATVFF